MAVFLPMSPINFYDLCPKTKGIMMFTTVPPQIISSLCLMFANAVFGFKLSASSTIISLPKFVSRVLMKIRRFPALWHFQQSAEVSKAASGSFYAADRSNSLENGIGFSLTMAVKFLRR